MNVKVDEASSEVFCVVTQSSVVVGYRPEDGGSMDL
jgi:hypothetical protein